MLEEVLDREVKNPPILRDKGGAAEFGGIVAGGAIGDDAADEAE